MEFDFDVFQREIKVQNGKKIQYKKKIIAHFSHRS